MTAQDVIRDGVTKVHTGGMFGAWVCVAAQEVEPREVFGEGWEYFADNVVIRWPGTDPEDSGEYRPMSQCRKPTGEEVLSFRQRELERGQAA